MTIVSSISQALFWVTWSVKFIKNYEPYVPYLCQVCVCVCVCVAVVMCVKEAHGAEARVHTTLAPSSHLPRSVNSLCKTRNWIKEGSIVGRCRCYSAAAYTYMKCSLIYKYFLRAKYNGAVLSMPRWGEKPFTIKQHSTGTHVCTASR